MEFHDDVATMICASIVMLIASFLFLDVLISVYKEEKKDFLAKAQERQDRATEEIKKSLDEIIKYEKAIYVVNKRELVEIQQEQTKEQASDTAKFKVL